MIRLIPYIIAFAAALVTLGFRFYQSKTSMSTIKHPHNSEIFVNPPSCAKTEEERFRVSFGVEPGGVVNGWPSKGGVYILESCLGIDLDFLKLDRFQKTRQPPQSGPEAAAEEEAHCNRSKYLLLSSPVFFMLYIWLFSFFFLPFSPRLIIHTSPGRHCSVC